VSPAYNAGMESGIRINCWSLQRRVRALQAEDERLSRQLDAVGFAAGLRGFGLGSRSAKGPVRRLPVRRAE
jgi:hypothetical protein